MAFVQLVSDNFHRPDEQPLNPTNWTDASALFGGPLAVVSDVCCGSLVDGSLGGGESYTGVTFPDDQYSTLKIAALFVSVDFSNSVVLGVRFSMDASEGYYAQISENVDGSADVTIATAAGQTDLADGTVPLVSVGDVWMFAAVGETLTLYQNGVSVLSATDSSVASGFPALAIFPAATQTDTSVSLFTAGAVVTPPSGSSNNGSDVVGTGATKIQSTRSSFMPTLRNYGPRIN